MQYYFIYVNIFQINLDNVANGAFKKKMLWTDECIFHSDGRINRHNEHHYAEENPHCRKTTHIQGYYSVNVWVRILDDRIIGPFFFPENYHVNVKYMLILSSIH